MVVLEECDMSENGQLDACEVHDCMVVAENLWRAENCGVEYE